MILFDVGGGQANLSVPVVWMRSKRRQLCRPSWLPRWPSAAIGSVGKRTWHPVLHCMRNPRMSWMCRRWFWRAPSMSPERRSFRAAIGRMMVRLCVVDWQPHPWRLVRQLCRTTMPRSIFGTWHAHLDRCWSVRSSHRGYRIRPCNPSSMTWNWPAPCFGTVRPIRAAPFWTNGILSWQHKCCAGTLHRPIWTDCFRRQTWWCSRCSGVLGPDRLDYLRHSKPKNISKRYSMAGVASVYSPGLMTTNPRGAQCFLASSYERFNSTMSSPQLADSSR